MMMGKSGSVKERERQQQQQQGKGTDGRTAI
jgi:hypothetical protein